MNTRSKTSLTAILATAFAFLPNATALAWEAGDSLADLTIENVEGQVLETMGKVTLIDFWASWSAPCKASFPDIDALYQKYHDAGFNVIAINQDTNESARDRFLKQLAPSFPIGNDRDHALVKSANVSTMPSSFLVDRQGVVRYVHHGWHGKKSRAELDAHIAELLGE